MRLFRYVCPVVLIAASCGTITVPESANGPPPGDAMNNGGGPELAPTCAELCELMAEACPADGPDAQYGSDAVCEPTCESFAGWPAGDYDDYTVNSIGCRIGHAESALLDPAVHCAHAGPTGGNTCGTWCDNYCWLAMRNCSGDAALFADADACQDACAAMPDGGAQGDDQGDSVQCRMTHLTLAGLEPTTAPEHCPDGAPDSPVCVGDVGDPGGDDTTTAEAACVAYCAELDAACSPDNEQYDWAVDLTCKDYCLTWAGLPAGAGADEDQNSIACRVYHAEVAATANPHIHCPHAGPSGGGVCGSWCDNYCWLAQRNCLGPDQLYEDEAECTTACEALDESGDAGDLSGNTVQCRISALGLAGSDLPASAGQWCPSGGLSGGDACQ